MPAQAVASIDVKRLAELCGVSVEDLAGGAQDSALSAVGVVRSLEGAPAAAASGWLRAAEERLLLEQVLTVATAESTIATVALAPF